MRTSRTLIAALLLTTLLVRVPAARASVASLETVEGLAARCDAVVRGRIETCEARLSGDGRRIYTHVTVRRSEVWRGSAPSRLAVRIPGGTIGDLAQHVHGAPALRPGEEVVLFLRRVGPAFSIAALSQGKFAIQGPDAVPELHGLYRIPSAAPDGHRAVEKMPVAELERRVRSAR